MQLSGLCTNCALVMFRVYKCLCANYHNFVRGSNSCLFGPLITKCDITRNSYWIVYYYFRLPSLLFPSIFFLSFLFSLNFSFLSSPLFPSLSSSYLYKGRMKQDVIVCFTAFSVRVSTFLNTIVKKRMLANEYI